MMIQVSSDTSPFASGVCVCTFGKATSSLAHRLHFLGASRIVHAFPKRNGKKIFSKKKEEKNVSSFLLF